MLCNNPSPHAAASNRHTFHPHWLPFAMAICHLDHRLVIAHAESVAACSLDVFFPGKTLSCHLIGRYFWRENLIGKKVGLMEERDVCRFEVAEWGRGPLRDIGPRGCEGNY